MIEITDAVYDKLKALIADEDDSSIVGLRIFVQGGGCSGFQYGFRFADEIEDGDAVFEQDGVKVVVDPMSMMYLDGASIDYVKDITGEQFAIKNPNATTKCGCGNSFGA